MNIPNNSKLVTVAKMQQIEAAADAAGHSYAAMMEMAGQASARIIRARFDVAQMSILILVGPGNNGGDGLVCARALHEAGVGVRVYLWKRRTNPPYDYEDHFARVAELGIEAVHANDDADWQTLRAWADKADLVVDALLGTGNNRSMTGQLVELLRIVQQARIEHTVAIDCPSGLNCDTGALDPQTLAADLTVTFGYAKAGHYQFPGAASLGELIVADIGLDPNLIRTEQSADQKRADGETFVLTTETLSSFLPQRVANSHKGTFGKAMIVAGCMNYAGAAYLACSAAGRSGAGLVTGAIPQSVWTTVASRLAEATWLPLPQSESGHMAADGVPMLVDALAGYSSLLVGCGLGNNESTQKFMHDLFSHRAEMPPTLIDADGLNCLAQLARWPGMLPTQTVLTPHAREFARLSGLPLDEVLRNRWALAREKAAAWQTVLLVKGPFTVIANPNGALAVLPVATSALATAGTGDVLAGTIAGLLAQGIAPFPAACLGAWIHGEAGKLCEDEIGLAGVLASDLLLRLPRAMNDLRAK